MMLRAVRNLPVNKDIRKPFTTNASGEHQRTKCICICKSSPSQVLNALWLTVPPPQSSPPSPAIDSNFGLSPFCTGLQSNLQDSLRMECNEKRRTLDSSEAQQL
ncbi:hypothetical protein KC19_9G122100 [Ceratodon purpureus]|uniref:Uncharacterized protein n=1 Tax=Ceratodon purpureus TaxID=3225 RepID=A0A8T0GUS2_CERPU|nr:hypothetical protein KC19_9G122100 [Ceratodon purpureus]